MKTNETKRAGYLLKLPAIMNKKLALRGGFVSVVVCSALCGAWTPTAQAALQWDGNGTTAGVSDAASAWNTANNWWNGSANTSWVNNSDAQFGTGTLGTGFGSGSFNALNVSISGANPIVNSITFSTPYGALANFNITGGTVSLANASTDITVNGGRDAQISSTLAGTVASNGLNKQGGGLLRLNGSVSYTGATTISAGTLRVNSTANSLYTSTSEFFMNGGNFVTYNGSSLNIAKNLTFNSASGYITSFDSSATINYTLSGTMTVNNGAVMNIRPRNAGVAGVSINNFDVTGMITGDGGFMIANGGNDQYATAAAKVSNASNNYSGSTTISGARLVLGNSDVIPNASTVTMNNTETTSYGTAIPSLNLNGKSETIAGLSSTASGALIFNNSGSGTSTLTVGSGDTTSSYAGVIKDYDITSGGIVALTKTGSGTLTLSGQNTYTGLTTVANGILKLTAENVLSTNTCVAFTGGKLDLNFTGTQTVDRLTINGVWMTAGTYGSSSSLAQKQDDTHFSGTGALVQRNPHPPRGTMVRFE